MPIDNNKLKKVWDTLRNGGYTQDYKTFVKGFSGDSNYENRKKVYDLLTENGAQIGKDYGEFMSKLHTDTPIRRAPQPKPTPTVKNPLHLPEGFGTVDLKDPMAKVRDANEVSDAVRGIESGNAEKAAAGRKKLAGVSARLEKEREAAKPAMDLLSAPLTEEQKSYVRHRKDAADYQAETGRKMPSVFGAGFERFGMLDADDYTKGVAPARIFVPEAERDEKGRITGRYSITSDKGAQRADRDARQGAIDRLKTIDAEEAEKERLSTTEGKDAEIADTESRIKELDAKMAARRRKLGIPQGGGTLSIAMNVAANADEEYNALSAARRQEELRLRSLKDRRFGGNDDYWWQIYRGAQGAVEKFLGYDTASDLAKYRAAGSASGFDKGVDEARQMFMEALDKNEREQAVAAGSGGLAREFGQLTGNSAIYMLPFMFGGKVIGGIQTLSRAAMRGAVKTAAGQVARKGVASALGRYTKRALGAVAEDMAIGLTGASTVGMPTTLGQAAENYAGKLEQDENGRYYYTGGDDTAHAFVTALLSNSFEYSSEMAGEHMESLWKAGKKSFAKTRLGMSIDRLFAPSKDGNRLVRYYNGIKSGAEAWLERLRKTKAGSAAYNAADFITEGGARMFRHAHIQDLPFEGLEEELNNIENAAFQTGQGSWEDVADNEQRWKLWAGLAISMATTGAVFGGISTVQYGGRMAGQYRAKHLMDRADVLARYRMTEEVWKPIKDGLDNADNADMGTVIAKALGTVKTDEERKEILNYARRLLEYRGYNIATTVGAAQGDGGADAGDMAYSEGYETTDANDMHNIKTRYEEARRKVEADGVNPDGTDVRTHIEMMLGARNEDGTPYYTDEEVQPYIDYLNAKAAFDGSLERVRDDIDSGVAESEAAVDRRTGKDGMVHPAVMKQPKADGTERSVYILAGNVEFTGDGGVVIDPKDTRGSIVVCGEDGTMEMVSPDAIREVGDAIDPETEKEEAAEAVRQRIAQDAADKFDNTPKYGVNDTFVMTGADGTPVSGVVQRVSEDGVEAAVGGRVALIPTEQFEAAVQEVRDAYGNVSWRRTPEDAAEADVQENGENVPNTTESVQGTPGNAPQDLVEEQKPDAAVQENGNSDAVGRSLSESETETVISEMKSGAQAAPEMELNPKNWLSQFGEDGVVTTPIGNVKMGENQYFKLAQRGRDGKLGMVKPTLETPDVIVEDSSKAKENGAEERPSSYVFVKTFTKADGSRYYHFTSVTVSKDGGEVVVSNQEKSENRISRLLRNGRIVWIDAAFSLHPTAQDRVSVPLGDSNRLTPTDSQSALLGVSSPEHSAGKDTEQNSDMQAEGGENASALSLIPKDANGEPVYTAADAYTAWDALVEQCGGDAGMAQGVADSMVKDMETALKKAEKSAPAHGVTVAEKIAAAKGHKAAVEKARTELEKWRAIAGETASRARAAEEAERRRKKERLDAAREELRRNGRYAKEDAALGDYTDFADYAMRTIATGKYRFLWGDRESGTQGLGAHLGFTGSRTERNKRIWLLSKDGFTPEEAAERMLADYSAAAGFDSVGDTGVDSMEALDVILDVLRRYTSPRAMMDDAKAAHAENGESAEERRQGEEYERGQFMEAYHMTPEEYYEYENEWLPRYMEEAAQVPQEVIDNINAEYAEKYSENGKDDYNGGEDARGVPPVQGERLDKPGGDEGGGDTGGAAGAVGEGDAAGGFVPQGASGREVRAGEVPQPVGKGAFGDIYDQFRGDAKAAFDFLTKHRSGDLLGVFHRDDTGDIDLVWGDENSGLSHILTKHVGKGKDFGTEQAAFDKIESILKNGKLIQDGRLRYVVSEDGYRVAIRKDYDGVKKNWIVTAVDYNRSKEEKEITTNPTSASHGANGPELAAPNNSKGKVTEESADLQENGGKDAGGKAEMPLSEQIDAASAEVNTEPTEAQKEAGNYKKGHVQVGMFDITIEQPEGSIRRGTDADGKQWESKMHNTYGYFRGTEGVDGDHIDVFLSNDIDGWNGRKVFVVDQYNPDGTFDEHKVMLGFNDMDEAKGDYLANYEKGWEDGRRIVVSATNLEDFEKWIDSSHRKTKPFAEYAGVKKETVANTPAKEEAAAPTDNANNAAYTITPATYTNKKGKTSDVSLLTFNDKLTADQERAVKEFAKERLGEGRFAPARGWKDRESGGWMFRSEEDARKAAEMVGNDDAVADNQPLTAQELRDAVEPKKPTASKKTAAKKPANRVEVADVAEQKPSEPTKAEQPKQDGEKKLVITDEMKHDEDILRELLGIGDEELDGGIKFRDPDAMTSQQRRFVYNAGVNYSLGYIDQGFVKFPEFAKAMVSRLGYKIKPWLKSFYEGAKRIPGYDQTMFTPTEEVDAFDVENFDKPNKDVMAQANMIVEEGKAQVAAEKANNELKATRNEQRKETEKQTAADTDAVAAEAETVASETESLAETSSDEQALNGAAERVDETLDKVNDQLVLLGYYEVDQVEKDFNEAYGYMRNAEKKAVKDAANLASQLISDLNLSHYEASHSKQADKKGNRKKKPLAVSNISPIGGDVSIHLPLEEGRELYLTIGVEPRAAKGVDGFGGSDLEVTHIMFRVDHPEGTGNDRYGRNVFVDSNVTYSDLLKQVQREAYKYLIGSGVTNEGEYAAGDKVQYSTDGGRTWTDAVVVQPNDEGGIRIDTGLAPVMWVNAHPDQLRHKPSESAEPKHEAIAKQKELDAEYNKLGQSEEDKTKFRLLDADDPKAMELESLPESELVPVYRNVQAFEDDALGSPMAFTDAETGERRTLEGRRWNYSAPPKVELTEEQQRKLDELNKIGYIMVDGKKSTELQINDGLKFVKPKTKEAQLQYFLKKNPEDKGLWAAYDPYDHAIETPLNTQFGEAYKRPNLVVVRSLIPKSEIDEPFHADYALLPTGAHQWNNGRTLYLSRWSKIDKVLTREEEAKLIDEYWKKHPGKREELKTHRDYNRFVPQVRRELEKMGYRFELDGKELTPEESLALDKQNWESRDVIPGREGHTPFVSNEDIARINAKMAGKWVGEPKEAMESAMSERVTELSERLHTPVRIIRTDEEVAALPSTRQRRMKGSFNPMTGEVTIVVPNNANMADVENTFLHEVVGHDGLRVLFPEEEKLNNALDELYRVSKDGIQDTIDRMARKMYDAEVDRLMRSKRREQEASGGNADAHYFTDLAEAHVEADRKRGKFKRDATEEYGADLAGRIGEKGFEKMSAEELTFWGRLKAVLQNALRKLAEGLGIPGVRKWGDNEWAFVLHEAYKRKRNGGKPSVADAADTVAARESSGFDGELYRVGDVKTFRDGRGIEFRRKPTATFNALLAHLEKEGVKTERHKARTGSEYASFGRYGVMYEVRNADHTKAKSADRRAEESGVEVTDWDGMIRHIDMDLVQARMNAADVYALMDEAERFNSEDEAVRRAATEDGVGSAEFRDAYPTLWRVMGLKSPEEARMEHLRKKYADEYYTARGKELDKLYPFTASNGVTIGRGRKFRVPKSIVYGKGDARRAAEEEFDKAYKKVYDEFIPLDDFVRQREQEGNLEEVNRRFNEQLQLYRNGEMDKNEMLRLGRPQGVMRAFLPNLPIVMRQRILTKGSVRKHNVSVEALANMPTHLAHPIFVFKRSDNALGVLTEMQDRDGKNICVAIELNRQIQNGGEILEVNDIRSVHGRNVSDIVYPIVQNGTLEWADKEKGLAYLSSASRYVQQEIDKQDLDTAAKVVENFENPKVSDEKASDEDLMFRDGDNAEYNKALARDIYERRVSRGLFQTQEALQDSMLGLKEAMDAILKAEGKGRVYIEDVAGFENAYLGENRLSSVNQAECSEFGQRLFKPLLKEAARLAKTAEERAELTDYMMAKHGLERNEVMARRDARKKAREELAKELAKAEKSADKNAVADVKQRMKDRENELYKENRKRDYAGLTALTGMPYVGDAEDEARRMVADYEREHAVKTLWDRVNAVNAATLLKSYESGMISRETYDDIRGMYKNYIPLRGFDEKTAEDAYAYVSSEGRGGFNAPIRTAKGRKSKADDPFANMEAMAESAIMQGNRNVLVKQRFMNFAVNHPSDLVSISDLWLWKNDATGEWQPLNAGGIRGTEAIGEDDTPAEVARKMRDFEAAVEQAAKDDPEHFRRQKENPAVPYRVVESRDLRQHQVIVRRNGRDYVLTINGNPRAAQALNGLTNPDNDISGAIGKIMRFGEKVNRELSAFYTTRNPDFVVSNFLRDMMYANTMVWVKETPNYAVRFHMNVLKLNPAKMKLLLAKFRKGTLNDKDETERMFRQFMMNGGETGYSSVKDIDRRKNDIRRELKKYNGKIPLQGAYTLLGERLDEYNRAVENCARFAAFMTSRQMMRSIDRSVYDAKEISVNFNKKGSGAKFIDAKGQTRLGRIAAGLSGAGRSLYVFFNAAIQGTANYARQFRRHPVKALTGAAVMYLLGTLMAHIGGSGDDDDEKGNSYWDLPEWTRRSNIMFRAGGQWVCIPLPVEYRVFYGMGELAVSAIEGREQLTPGELASAVAAQLSQALPIDLLEGGGGLSNLMPSIVKPGVEAYTNTSWTGLPIYRKNDFNKNDPEWTKAYRNTNKYLVAVAEKLNEATGGDKYTKGAVNINPAQVEYLLNGYFGGVSGTVDKLVKSAETLAGQREYDPRSFLLLNRIVKKGDERTTQRAVNNEYARLEDKFDALGKRLRGYRHDTTYGIFDFAEKANFIYNSPEYMEMMEFNACKKAVDKCRTLIKNSASPEDAKGYEEKINGMKRDIVERLGKTKRPAARAGAYIGAGAFYKAFTEAKMKEAE